MKRITAFISVIISCISINAALTGKVTYNEIQCEGSAMPYPTPESSVSYPDSLTPVMINHVGRHGARYPSSASRPLDRKSVV